jgi:hypothetical protein
LKTKNLRNAYFVILEYFFSLLHLFKGKATYSIKFSQIHLLKNSTSNFKLGTTWAINLVKNPGSKTWIGNGQFNFQEQQARCFLNLQMLQLTSQLELDSSNLHNIMVHLFGEKLADQLLAKETMVWVQNGIHNVFCNCSWGWWLVLEEQWGKGMDLMFIIPHFILAKSMDALDVFWQLTTSSKTICDEIEWISFLCLPQWRMNFLP